MNLKDNHLFKFKTEFGYIFDLDISQKYTIGKIKTRITLRTGIPNNNIDLIFKGINLENKNKTLLDYNKQYNNKLLEGNKNEDIIKIMHNNKNKNIDLSIVIDDKIEKI